MDLTIVALYTICDDLLISIEHQEHPPAKMSDAEIMTVALVAARYFGGNQQTACAVLDARIHPKYVGTLKMQSSAASDTSTFSSAF